jgi:hypothetical protein
MVMRGLALAVLCLSLAITNATLRFMDGKNDKGYLANNAIGFMLFITTLLAIWNGV